MELAKAKQIADSLISLFGPHCETDCCEVAGSIRRGDKPEVKDIELVVCAKWENDLVDPKQGDLFGEVVLINRLYQAISNDSHIRWIKPGTNDIVDWQIKPDGKYWRGLLPEGIKLDCFLCSKSNFGLLFMIRTGPAHWSRRIVTQRYKGGILPDEYRVDKGHLWKGENIIETPTEQSVFDILGIPFIPPNKRGERK